MTVTRTILAAALLGTAATTADAAAFSKQVPIAANGEVEIRNVAGSVTISTWANNSIDVQGELGDGVERVDVLEEDGEVKIAVILPRQDWNDRRKYDAKLQIRLPAGVELDVSTVSASITVTGVRGESRLKSVSGSIKSNMPASDVTASTVSGQIELNGGGSSTEVRVSSVSGNITLSGVAGEVDGRTTSGDNTVAMTGASEVRIRSVSGDITVSGNLARDGELEATTMSGRIKANTKAPGGFRYDATSFSGRITNCFGGPVTVSDYGPGSRLEGTNGEGAAKLRLKSHSGNVEICDR